MENTAKVIGGNIRKYRTLRHMTREELAEALDLDTSYLGQCERGERQLGLSKTIRAIQFFGVSPNDIISVGLTRKDENKEEYLEEIFGMLRDCSDNQLLAVRCSISQLMPFLKD